VDDQNAIADGVAIDANDVWGAWILQGARLGAYPIGGNGTPDFEFSSFDDGSSGVASAKGADRMAYMESNAAGDDFRIHGFKSTSDGIPDWSFSFRKTDPNLPTSSKRLAVSRDGSTIAAVVSDEPATQTSKLYVFEADTGAIRSTWTDPLRMDAVDLTDDGSIALVTQDSLAVLVERAMATPYSASQAPALATSFTGSPAMEACLSPAGLPWTFTSLRALPTSE